jgi:hypothetical protein
VGKTGLGEESGPGRRRMSSTTKNETRFCATISVSVSDNFHKFLFVISLRVLVSCVEPDSCGGLLGVVAVARSY